MKKEKQINDLLDELEIPLTDNQLKRLEKQKERINKKLKKRLQNIYE